MISTVPPFSQENARPALHPGRGFPHLRQTPGQREEETRDEKDEADPRDIGGPRGHPAESQDRGNERDQEESQGPSQHDLTIRRRRATRFAPEVSAFTEEKRSK